MDQGPPDVQYQRITTLRNAAPNGEGRRPLDEVKPSGLDQNGMIVAVTCADGDRIADILGHKWETHQCKLHVLALNGGAMLMSEAYPANSEEWPWTRLLRRAVLDAVDLKQAKLVALGSHYPCGMARAQNISVDDVICMTVDSRRWLKQERPDLEVYCFLHVAHPDGRPRTYTIDHKYPEFSGGAILQPARVAGSGGGW